MRSSGRWRVLAIVVALGLPGRLAAGAVSFELSALDGDDQSFDVALRLTEIKQPVLDLHLPAWTPGYYQLVDYAKGVSEFHAIDGEEGELEWSRESPLTWRVETGGATSVEIQYRVRATRQFVAESYLDEDYGYVAPTGVFMYAKEALDAPVTVHLSMPADWEAATGMEPRGGSGRAFSAANFDELYDCPILMGPLERIEFDVRGVPHAFVGRELGDFDRDEFVRDMTKMIESASAIVSETPYGRYQFLAIGPGPGGIEHRNTCAIGYQPTKGRSPTRSRSFMNFVTHEYFHLYNAKRIRPVELGPFDYGRENRTRMLWVAEGFTMYYEHLILKRAGLTTRDDVLTSLARSINAYESKPGRLVQSASEASWNTWEDGPFGRGDDKISCYDKGAALGMLIDFAIRHETGNRKSLDDVMRLLYWEYHVAKQRGYSEAEFRAACETVAGASLAEVLDYASTTAAIDYAKYLGYAGLALELRRPSPASRVGLELEREGDATVVTRVTDESAGDVAGLRVGDRLVAVDGESARDSDLRDLLASKGPGAKVEVRLARNGVEQTVRVELDEDREGEARFTLLPKPSAEQAAIFAAWMGEE